MQSSVSSSLSSGYFVAPPPNSPRSIPCTPCGTPSSITPSPAFWMQGPWARPDLKAYPPSFSSLDFSTLEEKVYEDRSRKDLYDLSLSASSPPLPSPSSSFTSSTLLSLQQQQPQQHQIYMVSPKQSNAHHQYLHPQVKGGLVGSLGRNYHTHNSTTTLPNPPSPLQSQFHNMGHLLPLPLKSTTFHLPNSNSIPIAKPPLPIARSSSSIQILNSDQSLIIHPNIIHDDEIPDRDDANMGGGEGVGDITITCSDTSLTMATDCGGNNAYPTPIIRHANSQKHRTSSTKLSQNTRHFEIPPDTLNAILLPLSIHDRMQEDETTTLDNDNNNNNNNNIHHPHYPHKNIGMAEDGETIYSASKIPKMLSDTKQEDDDDLIFSFDACGLSVRQSASATSPVSSTTHLASSTASITSGLSQSRLAQTSLLLR